MLTDNDCQLIVAYHLYKQEEKELDSILRLIEKSPNAAMILAMLGLTERGFVHIDKIDE